MKKMDYFVIKIENKFVCEVVKIRNDHISSIKVECFLWLVE